MSAEVSAGIATPRRAARLLQGARWWAGKGFWAVLDQALFATANFVLGILLARWLPPEQFGSFAVAYSAYLLVGTVHAGLLTEPMMVFGSTRHASRFSAYLDILFHAHWYLTGVGAVLLAAISLVMWAIGSATLAGAFLGAAVATPFVLFGGLVRSACLSRVQPQWAAAGGAVYFASLVGGSLLLAQVNLLSAFSALVLLGCAGTASGCWIQGRLRRASASATLCGPSRAEVVGAHWAYGRWAVASSALLWFPTNIYFMLLPAFAGLASAAALKATLNMVMPILHFNGALGTLLLTALATRVQHRSQFNRLVLVGLAAFTGGSVVYWSLLTTFRHSIIDWLYRGTYVESAFVVPIIALVPFTAAYSIVFGSALRALEQPRQVFWAHLGSAAVTLTLGIWATAVWGLAGAAAAILVASATIAVVCGVFLMRYMRAGQTQLAQTSVEEGR